MPDISKFALPPTYKGQHCHTWALLHGTNLHGAQCILTEGLLRPADWTYPKDPQRCGMPTFGPYCRGAEVARTDEYPSWAMRDLLGRSTKKGKGQQPVLIGALYRGKHAHLRLDSGGNEMAQLKIPGCGVVITSEKYTICHSRHIGICFFALVWHRVPFEQGSDSEAEEYRYRRSRHFSPLPPENPNLDHHDSRPETSN